MTMNTVGLSFNMRNMNWFYQGKWWPQRLQSESKSKLKFITLFWGGGKPPPRPIPNENIENLKL